MEIEQQSKRNEKQAVADPARILDVVNLQVSYHTLRGPVRAVNGVSFFLRVGERMGLVGESGSGKTTTALSLMRLIQAPAVIEGGEVWLDGQNLLSLSEEEMRRARFADIALIPQGAMNSLNPVMKVGEQLRDTFKAHIDGESKAKVDARILEVLEWVDLRPRVLEVYPHELSGGMKQRVALARALAPNPRVLLMDEPFASLDAMTREQLYGDLQKIHAARKKTILFVTHNVREAVCLGDRVLLFSPRPGRIRKEFKVELPRPREFNDVAMASRAAEITGELKTILAPGIGGSTSTIRPR